VTTFYKDDKVRFKGDEIVYRVHYVNMDDNFVDLKRVGVHEPVIEYVPVRLLEALPELPEVGDRYMNRTIWSRVTVIDVINEDEIVLYRRGTDNKPLLLNVSASEFSTNYIKIGDN
jgi:hypothetical protein